jgi:hypothetical protein
MQRDPQQHRKRPQGIQVMSAVRGGVGFHARHRKRMLVEMVAQFVTLAPQAAHLAAYGVSGLNSLR